MAPSRSGGTTIHTRTRLLGREVERLAIDRVLADGRRGRSAALALVGEPGIGKTALLDYADESASGMRVCRARGIDSETDLPFAGLAELLRPALGRLDQIPAPQRMALQGALALGPPTARDRFAIGAATLSLLAAWAEEAPVALLVDDAHLLDGSSAEALRFAARRLLADPIAMVLTVREGEPSLLDGADIRAIRVPGLDFAATAELLGPSDFPADIVERLHRTTGGNPLALVELAPEATRLAAWPIALPMPISSNVSASFGRRFTRLPDATRRVLVVAAAGDGVGLAVLAQAASSLGLDFNAIGPAEEAGLVSLTPEGVAFAHPLARSAVYAEAPAAERRAAHAALAAALPDRDVDRHAWYLAAATIGTDRRASAALEQAGARAHARTAHATAAAAFQRAAELAPTDEERGRLLLAAAHEAWAGGERDRVVALLGQARLHVGDALLDARIDYLEGHVAMRQGPITAGCARIVSAADRIAELDREQAVMMLAEAVCGWFYAGDALAMVAAATRAASMTGAGASDRASFFATIAQGLALIAGGRGDAGAAMVRRAVDIIEASGDLRDDERLLSWAVIGPMWLREASGRELLERAFERARGEAALGVLPALLHLFARDQATSDRWSGAETSYHEAIRLARETGQRTEYAAALAGWACLEARQGREATCRAHAAEAAELCSHLGVHLFGIWTMQALGDLELGLGRPDAAVGHHEKQAAALRSCGIVDVDLSPAPELVDAYLRLGRADEAATVAAEFTDAAGAKGQPWALARAARCRGLLAEAAELDAEFDDALSFHAQTLDGFETARTRLAYGACLRRQRQRVRAREQLRAAAKAFEQLGARSWADQARAELAATGDKYARRRHGDMLDSLTPQELQVARLLAAGKTTREAAAAVFLSPKTIEYHLGHVYRKLEIRSRAELAAIFDARDGAKSP